jgi:SIR2-like domain
MIDVLTALAFSLYENKGVYALLLGSGVSRDAQIPTGWEITLDLVRRFAALQGVTDQPDWASWHKEQFDKEPSYSELLDQLSATPDERRSILHSYIEPTADDIAEGRKVPTKAHHAIARLVRAGFIRVIITTNFDRLIENALRDAGVEPTVIKSDDDIKGAVPLTHSRCFVVKVHGDYLDTRIRNTDRELSSYSTETDALLDRIIDEHGLIICGWSGEWDPALRAAITRAPNRRYPLFWATRRALAQTAEDLNKHRAGRSIPIASADSFFEKLEEMVSVQADLQRTNPRSTELLVSSTKKYLGRPEFRIQLDELIGGELRHIAKSMEAKEFDANGGWSTDRYVNLVARYEALLEPLARIFGVLGRWGIGDDFTSASEIVVRFGTKEIAGGLVILLALRTYPGVLLFYAYGIGLLKARRYRDLYRLFSAEISTPNGDKTHVVGRFLLGAWEGMEDDPWKFLPGLEKRRTALSDHLYEIFGKWTEDYIFVRAEFTRVFEEFELLGSLAFTTLSADRATLQAAIKGNSSGRNFVWTPIGRAAWDNQNRRSIIEGWQREETAKALLDAGFARNDRDYMAEAIQNLNNLAACSHYQW